MRQYKHLHSWLRFIFYVEYFTLSLVHLKDSSVIVSVVTQWLVRLNICLFLTNL